MDWIIGKSLAHQGHRVEKNPYFTEFLYHLKKPNCLIALGRPGLIDYERKHDPKFTEIFYRKKDDEIEMLILPPAPLKGLSVKEIEAFLYKCGTDFSLHSEEKLFQISIGGVEQHHEKQNT